MQTERNADHQASKLADDAAGQTMKRSMCGGFKCRSAMPVMSFMSRMVMSAAAVIVLFHKYLSTRSMRRTLVDFNSKVVKLYVA